MVFNEASEPLEGEAVVSRLPELSSPVILKNLWYESRGSSWLRLGSCQPVVALKHSQNIPISFSFWC